MPAIRVAIVEDDPEFRRRFASIVEQSEATLLVGAAATAKEGHALVDRHPADIYLVDLGLPDGNGIDLIRYIGRYRPDAKSMVVTLFGDDDHIIRSIQAGATGYLLKDALPGEMERCLVELHGGGSPMSPVIARRLLRLFRIRETAPSPATRNPLSEREIEILTLVARGMSFGEIGDALDISAHTVTAHARKIYQKLSVHSRTEAVHEARQLGWLP